ncbi:lytic transglycosylase domain-containing protein [Agrobacterium tumefaciens]|uniref:lytic transglycosylase domain-containing protein n=1 Tax=Agrobacterium tumefaciens TaxID=358 RepID=UPI00220D2A33|nr:lytic transglycosylase domain-containing protein [Agrobacterium tumefaciens]MEA1844725.1 lytic transglycosylase domain-containing protein [Agrobacterium tumefaciens]UXU09023.1 lytic transglycosylase domain-containing protein [Agrobacterium tumefaciens]
MKKENALLFSLLVSVSQIFAAPPSSALEIGQATENTQLNSGYISEVSAATAYGFEQRWSGGDRASVDFHLQSNEDAAKAEGSSQGTNKRGFNFSHEKRPFRMVPEPSTIAPPAVSSSEECGPSPLSPDQIEKLVRATATRFGVDEELAAAVAWAESRFDQQRNSEAGARGPMQLIPATAQRFKVSDICDPAQNIEGGVKYLRFLLDEFTNPILAVAAYNSGEGRIYEHGGIPPFRETVEYVAKVTNYQLGVTLATKKVPSTPKPPQSSNEESGSHGVIPVQKNGKFVAGIMHF